MRVFLDILFLIVTTAIMLRSFHLITGYKSTSLSDFCILLLYIFQCLPVLLDYIIGRPEYRTWYSEFRVAIDNDGVSIIYDLYVLTLFVALYYLSKRMMRREIKAEPLSAVNRIPDYVLWIFVLLPFIYIIAKGQIRLYLIYASSGARGLESNFTTVVSNFLIIGIFSSILLYFRKEPSHFRVILLAIYSFLAIWVSGKRYIVATITFCFFFMYILCRRNKRKRLNAKFVVIFGVVALLVYSIYYITNVKITSDGSWQSIYAMTRIDFGRDDVVKFTIMKEYFEGQHILDYPCETVISTIFMIVPRELFPSKAYPHYRYLTAALFHTSISSIPAGMTPSILEMMIANFRLLGMPICIIFFCWYCKKADKAETSAKKFVYAIVLMGMLTQSLDSMLILPYVLLYIMIFGNVRFTFGRISRQRSNFQIDQTQISAEASNELHT